jgi:uncharacterized membrane protein
MIFVLLALAPAKVLFVVFTLYALSGILMTLYSLKQKKALKNAEPEDKKK